MHAVERVTQVSRSEPSRGDSDAARVAGRERLVAELWRQGVR
ncbi:hypothetical protein [Leifsonia sp. NPDC077715]